MAKLAWREMVFCPKERTTVWVGNTGCISCDHYGGDDYRYVECRYTTSPEFPGCRYGGEFDE